MQPSGGMTGAVSSAVIRTLGLKTVVGVRPFMVRFIQNIKDYFYSKMQTSVESPVVTFRGNARRSARGPWRRSCSRRQRWPTRRRLPLHADVRPLLAVFPAEHLLLRFRRNGKRESRQTPTESRHRLSGRGTGQ